MNLNLSSYLPVLKRVKVNLLEICIVFTVSYLSLRRAVLCFQCLVLGFSAGFDIFFAAGDGIIYVLESVNNLEEKKRVKRHLPSWGSEAVSLRYWRLKSPSAAVQVSALRMTMQK